MTVKKDEVIEWVPTTELLSRIQKGLHPLAGKPTMRHGRDALTELRERIQNLQSYKVSYKAEHRDDRYDGLS